MCVYDLVNLIVSPTCQKVNIYDTEKGIFIFEGFGCEIPKDLGCSDIASIDNILEGSDVLTINI